MKQTRIVLDTKEEYIKLAEAFKNVGDFVARSYGPNGCKTAFHGKTLADRTMSPVVINDGYTILKELKFQDNMEDFASKILLDSANQVNNLVGDGTTTAIILTSYLAYYYFLDVAENIGNNDFALNEKKFREAEEFILSCLQKVVNRTPSIEQIRSLAKICSRSDEIAQILSEVFEKTGKDSYKVLSFGGNKEIEYDMYIKSSRIDTRLLGMEFYTDQRLLTSTINNPKVVFYSNIVNSFTQIKPLIDLANSQGYKDVILFATGFNDSDLTDTLKRLIADKSKVNIYPLQVALLEDKAAIILEDLSVLTGATFIDARKGMSLEHIEVADFGDCAEVYFDNTKTIIKEGNRNEEEIENRLSQLKILIEERSFTQALDINFLTMRKKNLLGSITEIRIGANTITEMRDLESRFDDALRACNSAYDLGIIEGAGVPLAEIGNEIEVGYIKKALNTPYNILLSSANIKNDPKMGVQRFNFTTKEEVDNLFEIGVMDSYGANSIAVKTAFSVIGKSLVSLNNIVINEIT